MKKFLLISALGLALAGFMVFFWLLGCTSGNLCLLSWITRLSPYKVTATIEEPLLTGLKASSLKFDGVGLKVAITKLELAWRPQALWAKKLSIKKLKLDTLKIDYQPAKTTAAKAAPRVKLKPSGW